MPIKVYRTSERIPIKIGDATFYLSPFTQEQKLELMQHISTEGGTKIEQLAKFSLMVCKFSIKDVKGLIYDDGTAFKLELDEKGVTDKCLNELMNTEISPELVNVCQSFLKGVPKEIIDPQSGEKLKNVTVMPIDHSKKNMSVSP